MTVLTSLHEKQAGDGQQTQLLEKIDFRAPDPGPGPKAPASLFFFVRATRPQDGEGHLLEDGPRTTPGGATLRPQ